MSLRELVAGRSGRVKEYAKLGLRSQLYRRNLDLIRHPYPVRVAAALRWLPADTVLDVGANIGQYASALRSSGYAGRIVSCEPLPDAYAHLARRSATDPRWTALNTAVGSAAGTVQLHVAANSYSSSLREMTDAHLRAAPGSHTVATRPVEVTTLAAVVSDHAVVPEQTLLKIDTQGYEAEVLDGAGALLPRFAAVQLEMSLVPLYAGQQLADALGARLADLGFAVYALEPGFGDDHTGRMLQYDALFVRADRLPTPTGERP